MTARLVRPGFLAVLLAAFAAGGVVAQEPDAPPVDGMNEGVAVHGDWTITIVRDGEVVDRREFENALTEDGESQLALLLAGQSSVGAWNIAVLADNSGSFCDQVNPCFLIRGANVSTPDGTVVLEGSTAADADGNLQAVDTRPDVCGSTTAPADCSTGAQGIPFTAADLDPVIPVQSGDLIEVTVVLSFN